MADRKDYLVQSLDNGSVMISEEVIASIAALAVRDVDGVYGLSISSTLDIANIIGRKNLRKGIRVSINAEDVEVACNLVVKFGENVMDVAKKCSRCNFHRSDCYDRHSAQEGQCQCLRCRNTQGKIKKFRQRSN